MTNLIKDQEKNIRYKLPTFKIISNSKHYSCIEWGITREPQRTRDSQAGCEAVVHEADIHQPGPGDNQEDPPAGLQGDATDHKDQDKQGHRKNDNGETNVRHGLGSGHHKL